MIDQEHGADRPPACDEGTEFDVGADRTARVDLAVSADVPTPQGPAQQDPAERAEAPEQAAAPPRELGGRKGPDPTRYGDWELRGRCIDF
jgi:hypothetical protein